MFSIKASKAPGPDGFPSRFFQENWEIVGKDVVAAVTSFFRSGKLLKEWNSTAISFIPKVAYPNTMRDFRPISCCKTVYKTVSKVIVARMKPLIPKLVDGRQSAFVQGRSISENIMLMQQFLRNSHRSGGTPRCAIKVDLLKAYDSIEWNFLFNVLKVVGFPPRMLSWITECVSTIKFSISLDG